jgi:high-affinity iron transporter
MLLDAILTVLRETLEAGVLVSLLASASRGRGMGLAWLIAALGIGIAAAIAYALNLQAISGWFDGVGQELLNASLQYSISILLLAVLALLPRPQDSQRVLAICMGAIVVLSVSREAGEILIFLSSYLRVEAELERALTSGFVGLFVGLSVGMLTFLLLTTVRSSLVIRVQSVLLALVCIGMAVQGTQLLTQADWLPSGEPMWDSNWLLEEKSMIGQMVYAVFGYEATPAPAEVVALALSTCCAGAVLLWRRR